MAFAYSGHIHLLRKPTGGLGNRLFTYYYLLSLAKETNKRVIFHFSDNEFLFERITKAHFGQRMRLFQEGFFCPQKLNRNATLNANYFEKRRNVVLWQRFAFLGDSFCSIQYSNPRELFGVNSSPMSGIKSKIIALHYRGSDFKSWNPRAIMPPEFYLRGLQKIGELENLKNFSIKIFTDDAESPELQEVECALTQNFGFLDIKREANHEIIDFLKLANAKYIVGSPSTFGFWASQIGLECKWIISKKWLDERAMMKDRFWEAIKDGTIPELNNILFVDH